MFRIIYLLLCILFTTGFPNIVNGGFGIRVGTRIIHVEKLEDRKPFNENVKLNEGIDERYDIEVTPDNESITKINLNFRRRDLLRTLESVHYSLENKLALIRENSHLSDMLDYSAKGIDLYAGGLMHEFDNWSDEF